MVTLRNDIGTIPFIYINDLPNITNKISKILLFVDDSSIIITKPNTLAFINKINKVLTDINEWIKANLFSLNVDKNNFIKFSTKNISLTNLNIIYDDKGISIISNMNFLE